MFALAIGAVACGDGGEGSAVPGKNTVEVTFAIVKFAPGAGGGGAGTPLEGAEVCAIEPAGACATTNAEGRAAVTVPATTRTAVRVSKAGFLPAVAQAVSTAEDTTVNLFLAADDLAATLAQVVQIPWPDPERGVVAFNAEAVPSGSGVGREGVSVGIDVQAAGPFYTNAMFLPDPSLMASSVSGLVFLATIAPGDHTITFSHPSSTCVVGLGWPTDAADELVVRVQAGAVTVATVTCP